MSIQSFSRWGVALFAVALVSGCSLFGGGKKGEQHTEGKAATQASVRSDECRGNRRKCIYEGNYEAGEEAYAEQEARRLNQAQLAKLRRRAGR